MYRVMLIAVGLTKAENRTLTDCVQIVFLTVVSINFDVLV